MGLKLTITWESNAEKNVEWTLALQNEAKKYYADISPKIGSIITNGNNTLSIKQVTSGCGSCGNMTQHYESKFDEFVVWAKRNVLAEAKDVIYTIKAESADEF